MKCYIQPQVIMLTKWTGFITQVLCYCKQKIQRMSDTKGGGKIQTKYLYIHPSDILKIS